MGKLRYGATIEYFTDENGIIYGKYVDTKETFVVGGNPFGLAANRSPYLSQLEYDEVVRLSDSVQHAEFILREFTEQARILIKKHRTSI